MVNQPLDTQLKARREILKAVATSAACVALLEAVPAAGAAFLAQNTESSQDSADQPVRVTWARDFPQSQIDAVKQSGSGISGPGRPIRSGFDLGQADSAKGHVKVTAENRESLASGSVVKQGFLPDIQPVWDLHIRDTQIILGPDNHYYMTGSTGNDIWEYNDGIELYRSRDLHHWTYMGLVWSIERDGGWEKQWRIKNGRPIRSVWAPEIHYVRGNYYICFAMPPGGISILKSSTGRPQGPYEHATNRNRPLLGGMGPVETSDLIDPTLFEDEDSRVYFSYGAAREIARMKDDLSGFAEPLRGVSLLSPDHNPAHHHPICIPKLGLNDIGFEGATIFKRNGNYYLGSTDIYDGRYTMMLAISDHVYGPYRMRHATIACNGGTGFFKAKDGYWYTSIFGDDAQAPWREKPGILRVEFSTEGRVQLAPEQPSFLLRRGNVDRFR
jgi:hypothetical protein